MSKHILSALLALVLVFCLAAALVPSAAAEETEAVLMDVSDHVLQAGGWLPEASPRPGTTRGDPYAAVKTAIYNGLIARLPVIDIQTYNVPLSDIGAVFRTVLNNNPDLFYVTGRFSYSYYGSTVSSITPGYDNSYTEADVTAYRNTVQQILGMLDPDWSDVEKLLFLHDYLVTHCEYDLTYSRYNAHDALVVKSAVCQGYALAFNNLCREGGIGSQLISSSAINHAWNLVTVGGESCYVDCTWDDPSNNWYEGRCLHSNFLQSRSSFEIEHNSTDWTNGSENVYGTATTSRYDDAWWQDVVTAVPRIGHLGAYTLEDDSSRIYLRNLSGGGVTTFSLPGSASWPVWNQSGSSWVGNYSSAAVLNGLFYFTLPTEIWTLTTAGEMNRAYSLTSEERAQGYLYGIVNDGNVLYYSIGTKAWETSFVRTALDTGPVTGESGGFHYQVLPDGTASIVSCKLTGDVVIPDKLDGYTVTNLAAELFYGASGIRSVTIPATVTSFGEDPTDNDWDYVFSYCYDLRRIDVDKNNPTFCSVDGVLYAKDKSRLINYPCSRDGEVYHAAANYFCCTSFAACRNLKFLFIDNPNTRWYTYTFYNTPDLTAFWIPGGLTEKKVAAEREAGRVQDGSAQNPWCALVSTEEIRYLPAQLTCIEADAFRGTDIAYFVAPQGCKRIETGAFSDSGLRYLRVGAKTVIENGALPASAVVERVS